MASLQAKPLGKACNVSLKYFAVSAPSLTFSWCCVCQICGAHGDSAVYSG